jgi:hypothetical protein
VRFAPFRLWAPVIFTLDLMATFRRVLTLVTFLGLFASHASASPESEFWQWFGRNHNLLFNFERDREAVFDQLAAAMHKVHPSLTFEFGPKSGGQREFVISADGDRKC